MEEQFKSFRRMQKEKQIVQQQIKKWRQHFKTINKKYSIQNYLNFIQSLNNSIYQFSSTYTTSLRPTEINYITNNYYQIINDLISKFKTQLKKSCLDEQSIQVKNNNSYQYCINCHQNLRALEIQSLHNQIINQKGIGKLSQIRQDIKLENSLLFSERQDIIFYKQLNNVINRKQTVLAFYESKLEGCIHDLVQSLTTLNGLSQLVLVQQNQGLTQNWIQNLKAQIQILLRSKLEKKLPKMLTKMKDILNQQCQNKFKNIKSSKQINKSCQTSQIINQQLKIIKLKNENLEKQKSQLEEKIKYMKSVLIERIQQNQTLSYNNKLIQKQLKTIKQNEEVKINVTKYFSNKIQQSNIKSTEQGSISQDINSQKKENNYQEKLFALSQTKLENINPDQLQLTKIKIKSKKLLTNKKQRLLKLPQIKNTQHNQTVNIRKSLENKIKIQRNSVNLLSKQRLSIKKEYRKSIEQQYIKLDQSESLKKVKIVLNKMNQKILQKQQNKLISSVIVKDRNEFFQNKSSKIEKLKNRNTVAIGSIKMNKLCHDFFQKPSQNDCSKSNLIKKQQNQLLNQQNNQNIVQFSKRQDIHHYKKNSQNQHQIANLDISKQSFQQQKLNYNQKQIYSKFTSRNKQQLPFNIEFQQFQKILKYMFKEPKNANKQNKKNTQKSFEIKSINQQYNKSYQFNQFKQNQKFKLNNKKQLRSKSQMALFEGSYKVWEQKQRLFKDFTMLFNRKQSIKYQHSLLKNNMKSKQFQLNLNQSKYIKTLYGLLKVIKNQDKDSYNQITSYLRYPYQTVMNDFVVINIVSDISVNMLEDYFKKILFLHKKCEKNGLFCNHIIKFQQFLEKLIGHKLLKYNIF